MTVIDKELEKAKKKDAILRYYLKRSSNFLTAADILDSNVIEASESEISTYIYEIEFDGYLYESNSTNGLYRYSSTADFFLENGGYEALYLEEQSIVVADDMKYRKIARQDGFIRFVDVIKSGVWLFFFIISFLVNIFFVLKFLFKLF